MQYKVKDYTLETIVGEGAFGKVYKASKKMPDGTTELFAIKVISKENISQQSIEMVISEFEIGRKIQKHKNLVGIIDSIQTSSNYYMVFEYCDIGSLKKYLESKELISEKQAHQFICDINAGYSFLHKIHIVHRDIKADNILLKTEKDGSLCAKISDYGLSKSLVYSGPMTKIILPESVGTPIYMSPELLSQTGSNYQSDIFAIGILYYYMIFREYPFPAASRKELAAKYDKGAFIMDTSKINVYSAEFILGTMQYSIKTRYKSEHLKSCALFGLPYDLLTPFKVKGPREFNIKKVYKLNSTGNDLIEC
jgi:serine/threonine protein kinase